MDNITEASFLPEGRQWNTYEEGFMNLLKVHVDFSSFEQQKKDMREFVQWKKEFAKEYGKVNCRVEDVEHKLHLKKSYVVCSVAGCQREVADCLAVKGEIVGGVFRPIGAHCRPSVKLDTNEKWLSIPEIREAKEKISEAGFKVKLGYYSRSWECFCATAVISLDSN